MLFTCLLRDLFYLAAVLLLLPLILYRRLFQGRYQDGWAQRLGAAPINLEHKPVVWIHAVSVGEVNGIKTLVSELGEIGPGCQVVISTTTDTGMARARALYGKSYRLFYFPWDFTLVVRRAFSRLRPALCLTMEGEVWPNFTAVAQRLGVPVAVANGRVGGAKGWPRYRKLRWVLKGMFSRLSLVLAQDKTAAERFQYLGVPADKVQVVGSLKYDTAEISDQVDGAEALAAAVRLPDTDLVWVCGSTGPGEEEILLESFRRLRQVPGLEKLRLVLVPRKPERFGEVAALIAAHTFKLLRYSRIKSGEHELGDGNDQAVILGDTMGDLRKFYALATVVFVGRSLVPLGGSDMMEVAALGKPVIIGPYTDNFMETVRLMVASGGIEVVADQAQLQEVLGDLLQHPDKAAELASRGRRVIRDNKGATRKSVTALAPFLQDDRCR